MNPYKIIEKYYQKNSKSYYFLVEHSKSVMKKAVSISKNIDYDVDIDFIKEASLLHDIGILFTNANEIDCNGDKPYLCHGVLGRKMLENEGFNKHALVCERHVGVGITKKDIIENNLPLPKRDMVPKTIEEEIVCFADKFFSKSNEDLSQEESISEIRKGLLKFGKNKVDIFNSWIEKFNYKF